MDFPGAISIGWDTFARYCTDVGRSLADHGFRRMLFLNGHGSNQNLVETAARLVMVDRPETLAAAAFYLASPAAFEVIGRVRTSTRGGMAHACELETSIYLAIDPAAVAMDLAVDERSYPEGEHAWLDWSDGPLKLMPWWSSFSRSGSRATPPWARPTRAGPCWTRPWTSASPTWTSCWPSPCPSAAGRLLVVDDPRDRPELHHLAWLVRSTSVS
jgi:creatinine amidohydrolase